MHSGFKETNQLGIDKTTSWSMGSLHPATRYNIDRDYGALGHSRRADIVMLDDNLNVYNTWLGGNLVVENNKITKQLDKQLSLNRYTYPKKAYKTIKISKKINLIPSIPEINKFNINVIRTEHPGIVTFKEKIKVNKKITSWKQILDLHNLCHLCVIERHGKNGECGKGFIQNKLESYFRRIPGVNKIYKIPDNNFFKIMIFKLRQK